MIKYLPTFMVIFLFSNILIAQEHLNHPQKIYQADDGKLYIQKSLPLYIYISTEPGGKGQMHQLESDSTKAYANPMYLDTEGYNSFRSPSAVDTVTKQMHYPLTDVMFETYADSRSPRTKMVYDAKKKYFNGEQLFFGSGLKLELNARDVHSGLEKILVSVDSAGFKPYTEALVFDKEKVYDLNYYGVDNVGNAEVIHHKSFHVDLTSPATTLDFEGQKFENVISGKTKIKLSSEDTVSGLAVLYYSLDDKKFTPYKYALNSAYLTEGEHSIKYYAVDKVGNTEEEKSYVFYVDKTPPILVDEIMGNSYVVNGREYSSGRTKLKLTAVDNKAGVLEIQYNLNNDPYQIYEKPFYLTSVSGSLAVKSYAIDKVGNKSVASEKSTRSKASYVDLTGPTLKYSFVGRYFKSRDVVFLNKDSKIKITATDAESGVKALNYSVDGGEETPYTEPFALTESGPKELNIYGYDNVDNSNRITAKLIVDNSGPDIYSRFSVLPIGEKVLEDTTVELYPSHVVLFLSATDAQVAIDRIYYAVNGEPEKMYTGIIDGFNRGKSYNIMVKAYDKLGNSNVDTVKFATDNTGPKVFTRFSVHPVGNDEIDGETVDVYPVHASLFLSVTNAHVAYDKIYYSINGGEERLYKGIIDGFKLGATIKMKIRALDRLGNETEKIALFKIADE